MDPILIPAGAVIALALGIGWRWLALMQRKLDDHSERLAWLEAKTNGKHKEER